MQVEFTDFNDAELLFRSQFKDQWHELFDVLSMMPLHLKSSDQAGRRGNMVFDPVGTNKHIRTELARRGWSSSIPIPIDYSFLGTDVDFGKDGILVEAQFSTYAFLLNNTLRAELFFKSAAPVSGQPTQAMVIITKARLFPAANSTLYYEQARNQIRELARHNVFDVPIRLVGLFEQPGSIVKVKLTKYQNPRYSRTVVSRRIGRCLISAGRGKKCRCSIQLLWE